MILQGDCIEVMRGMEDNTVDALITDPPAGIGFMNKAWDHHKGGRREWVKWMSEVMEECLRVMKPGAHGLVWAIPRTSHWTGWALEKAGFEIRDCVYHLFGTGFPKSLDISKAIDKAAGVSENDRPISHKNISCRKAQTGPNGWVNAARPEYKRGPATDAAKQWQGWGTALKPAVECWWLVRKPISEKTVAKNVLKWGTGGLNIDGCRVATEEKLSFGSREIGDGNKFNPISREKMTPGEQNKNGRFPANLILDEQAAELLDEQSGILKNGSQNYQTKGKSVFGTQKNLSITTYAGDSGGASRFFYIAKPSKAERNQGLAGKSKKVNDGRNTPIDNAFQRGETERLNTHPTVKPIKLMRYLCRMITPPKGIVLDPFLGSGTTGCAAKAEGFRFTGIEMDKSYIEIAEARINAQNLTGHQKGKSL